MSYKDTGISNPGTSIKYGADDLEMVMRMFNGVTTGVGGPRIKTVDKWGFWDNIMFIRNQADTKSTFIRGQSNSPSTDVTLALPPIPANDTLTALGITNIFSTKQEFDDGLLLKQQSAPPNPASTFNHFYAGTNGHLIRRDSTGAEFDYDVAQNGLPAGLTKQIQYNNSGIFSAEAGFEYDASSNEATIPGLTVTEDLILNGVISPPQITTTQHNYNPTGLATATTLRLTTDTSRDITGIAAQPGGTILIIHNVGSFNIVLKDESTSSTTTNRFAMVSDLTLLPDNSACIKYDGTTGRWRLVSTDAVSSLVPLLANANIFLDNQTIQTDENDPLHLYRPTNTLNSFIDLNFDFNNSLGTRKTFADIRATLIEDNNGAEDADISINLMKAGTKTNRFYMDRDGQTYIYGSSLAEEPISLYRDTSTVNDLVGVVFGAKTANGTQVPYGFVLSRIIANANGAQDGSLTFWNKNSGVSRENMRLDNDGLLRIGRDGTNRRSVPSFYITSSDDINFINSGAENTMLSFTVIGNTVGVDGHVVVRGHGYVLQNSVNATLYTWKIKVGGTIVWQHTVGGSHVQDADARPFMFELRFYPSNRSTTTARMVGYIMENDAAAPTTGQGDLNDDEIGASGPIRATGISWTFANDTTIAITVTMDQTQAATSWQLDGYTAELQPS